MSFFKKMLGLKGGKSKNQGKQDFSARTLSMEFKAGGGKCQQEVRGGQEIPELSNATGKQDFSGTTISMEFKAGGGKCQQEVRGGQEIPDLSNATDSKLTVYGDVSNLIIGDRNTLKMLTVTESERNTDTDDQSCFKSDDYDHQVIGDLNAGKEDIKSITDGLHSDHKGTFHKESGYKPNGDGHPVITDVKTGKEDIKSKADGLHPDHKGTFHKESGYKPNGDGHPVITDVKTGKEDIKSKADGLHPDHKGTFHKESGYKPNGDGHPVITDVKTGKEDIKSKADGLHPEFAKEKEGLDIFCNDLTNSYHNILSARPVYKLCKGREYPIILAKCFTEDISNLPSNIKDLKETPIKYITKQEMSNEAQDIFKKELIINDSETKNLLGVIRKNLPMLWNKHSFINIVSISSHKSLGYGTQNARLEEKNCIVIYCQNKEYIPYDEDPFPTTLDGVDVDVREGVFEPFHFPNNTKVRVGDKILIVNTTCTLGLYLRHPQDGRCALTAGHGLVSKAEIAHYKITPQLRQHLKSNPRVVKHFAGDRVIGQTLDIAIEPGTAESTGIDIGLIQLKQDIDADGLLSLEEHVANLPSAGFDLNNPPTYKGRVDYDIPNWKDRVLYSSGPETGLTFGMLMHDGLQVKACDLHEKKDNIVLYSLFNQMEIRPSFSVELQQMQPFAKNGDSGAFVFYRDTNGDLVAVGIVIGGTSYGSCVMTPLEPICQYLGFDKNDKNPFLSFESDSIEQQIASVPNPPHSASFFSYGESTSIRSSDKAEITAASSDSLQENKIKLVMSAKGDLCQLLEKAIDSHQTMAGGDQLLKKHAMDKNAEMYQTATSGITKMVSAVTTECDNKASKQPQTL